VATYESKRKDISRTPVWYVKITLDFCDETFGAAPCVAVGTGDKKCLNTFPTCKDTANFNLTSKVYRFCSDAHELPFNNGERPYIKSVTTLPTEIKDSLPVLGRVKIKLLDEPDTDVGIDPYVTERSSTQGTFFKKLLARNPNYKGRTLEVFEGFLGIPESEFQKRFSGKLDNISFGKQGEVIIDGIDFIGDLKRIKIPPKFDIRVGNEISTASTFINFNGSDADEVQGTTGRTVYIRIGDEIISFPSSDYSTLSKIAVGITRAEEKTFVATHTTGDEISLVPHYNGNPWDVMLELLKNDPTADKPGAGISTVNIDETEFNTWRDWTGVTTEVIVDGFIDEEISVEEAYMDLVNLVNAKTWVGEDLKITIRRRVPNLPDRDYARITDEGNITLNTDKYNANEKSRFTRNFMLWDYKLATEFDRGVNFGRRDALVGLDEESSVFYGEEITNLDRTRFFRSGVMAQESQDRFVQNRISRQFNIFKRGLPLIDVTLETKDSNIKTGDYCKLDSDVSVDVLGNPLSSAVCQVVKRSVSGSKVNLTLERQSDERTAYITPSTATFATSFDIATQAEQNYGFFSVAETASSTGAVMPDGSPTYLIH
jgi:hypothetical protein